MGTTEDRLAAMEAAFKQASMPGRDELPPDGEYQAIVERFDTFESNAGALFLKTEMKIANNREHAGKKVEVVHSLEDPERMSFLKKHLAVLGLDPDAVAFSRLLDELHSVLDTPVLIAVKTSTRKNEKTGEYYRNVYVNDRLGEPLKTETPPEFKPTQTGAGVTPADDVPFDASRI